MPKRENRMEMVVLIALVLFGTKKKDGMFCKSGLLWRRHEMTVVREALLHLPICSLARAPNLLLY